MNTNNDDGGDQAQTKNQAEQSHIFTNIISYVLIYFLLLLFNDSNNDGDVLLFSLKS